MRIWIFGAIIFLGFAAPGLAADDDTVRGLLVACDAKDQVCLIDVLSGMQKTIFAGTACPSADLHEDEALDAVVPWLKDAVAKNPTMADQKSDDAVIRALKTIYPCPPPGAAAD
jgi:hypothetical protein